MQSVIIIWYILNTHYDQPCEAEGCKLSDQTNSRDLAEWQILNI